MALRNCLGCGQIDDHPRHVIHLGDTEANWHMDCHSRANPPCETCAAQIINANGATGDDLRAHLTATPPAAVPTALTVPSPTPGG